VNLVRKTDGARWIPRTPEPESMDDSSEARAYDEADFSAVNRAFAERVLALGGPEGVALDLGTGPASIPLELCAMAPGWRVTAVDIAPRMLARGRARLRAAGLLRRVELRRADVAELSRPAWRRRFDLVMSNSLLHHVADPIEFWTVVRRMTRDGGAIAVQDLFRPGSVAAADRLRDRHAGGDSALLQELFHRSLLAAYTPCEIRAQLAFAGLEALRVETVSDRHVLVTGRAD